VGYAAVNPAADDSETLARAITFTNRILGFVNAPAFFQRVAAMAWQSKANYSLYAARRDALMRALDDAGISYAVPEGAFYLFCKAPPRGGDGADDIAFCDCLKEQLVLCAPGSSFGCAGWFRMAYCVAAKTIENARSPLKKAVAAWGITK
jgi:aspartate aminotransferase